MALLRITKRVLVHAVLLAGCVVFAFPFFWLVSTSFKRNEELGVFPPRWIPPIPWYTERSPFVDGRAFDAPTRPDQLAEDAWERLRPAIEETLWAQAQAKLGRARLQDIRSMADSDQFRPQVVAGLWAQVTEIVPDSIWKGAAAAEPAPGSARNPLVDFAARAATEDMVLKVTDSIVRRLAVGEVQFRHLNNDVVPAEGPYGWQAHGNIGLAGGEIEGQRCIPLRYDLGDADAFTISRTVRLPVAIDQLQVMNLPIHCDASWHRAILTIETGGRVYRAERPLWLDIRTWQDAEFAFKRPPYRGSRAIVMQPEAGAAAGVADPQTYRLTLRFEKSSRLRTVIDKYIDSYRWAIRYIPFDTQLRNTVILVVLNVLGQLFACSLAAYGFARLKFYGRDFLFGLLLATMMLPAIVTMIPQFVLWKSLGWYNTLRPLWVPAWFGWAFFIFLLRQFFMTIPKELEDAAKIDGCGFFGIYWRIILPLAGPALATVAIWSFMGSWNEFVQPLVYLSDERLFPLSLGLNQFRQEQSAEWAMLMAASTLVTLPLIAVFFFCQRYFIQGITLTGLKG